MSLANKLINLLEIIFLLVSTAKEMRFEIQYILEGSPDIKKM
jgi:hypothetical protein